MYIYIVIAIVGFVSQVAAISECDGVLVDDICYFVELDEFGASRDEASLYCENTGGELAIIPSRRAFLKVRLYLTTHYKMQMILTALEYDHTESETKPLLPDGNIVPYIPEWFEGHPIRRELHGEIAYIPNNMRKFSGFMNIADGAKYLYFLCSKTTK